tara:strand:+ start:2928 stop:3482 length:555 start_codon:yes stop_codon:yes gene_type:complete
MSAARNLSKMINKENYITHSGHSSVSSLDMPTETSMVGMITSFSMTTASDWRATNRWLICDGSAISRTTYSDLFLVVGTTWGVGDGSSTFTLPDLRGQFLRGHDNGHGDDPDAASRTGGDVVGSSQADEFKEHNHDLPIQLNNGYAGGSGGARYQSYSAGVDTGNRGGNETRPRNVYVQYCIKY